MARQLLFFLSSILFVITASPFIASAQEASEAPLRIALINTAGNDGQRAYRVIQGLLNDSEQIELVDTSDFLSAAERAGLRNEHFRASAHRQNNIDNFEALMRSTSTEGLLIQDVFGGGNTLQLVVIGPRGWEIADIRHSIQRGRLDDASALEVLRQVFQNLVPEVRGFRREVEEERQALAAEQLAEIEPLMDVEPQPELDPREQAIAEHRRRYGNMERNFSGRVGMIFGNRLLYFSDTTGAYDLSHNSSFIGAGAELDALITTFDRDTAALEVGGFAAFAPYTAALPEGKFTGRFVRAGADFRYISARSPSLRLRGIAGLEFTNFAVPPNAHYTGHGYLLGRLGAGVHYAFGELMTLQTDALFMPILTSSNSGGAYGDQKGWLAYGADVGLHLDILRPFLVSVTYHIQRLQLDYPSPSPMVVANPMTARDMVHQAFITIGYSL